MGSFDLESTVAPWLPVAESPCLLRKLVQKSVELKIFVVGVNLSFRGMAMLNLLIYHLRRQLFCVADLLWFPRPPPYYPHLIPGSKPEGLKAIEWAGVSLGVS